MEISAIMDNDSGYVSHNQESNFDSSSENLYGNRKSPPSNYLYVSEDALLEKPQVKEKNNDLRSISFDSVINSSQASVKTEFSGFEDSDQSDVSFVVPEVKTIVWDSSSWKENSNLPEDINLSQESSIDWMATTSKPLHRVLSNVTNTYDQSMNQSVIKNTYHDNNKENIDPSETPKKQYENRLNSDISPDLFAEEEEELSQSVMLKEKSPLKKKKVEDKDMKLLKRVQSCLSGVYPPPSLTMIQINAAEMLSKIENNKELFWVSGSSVRGDEHLRIVSTEWPDIVKLRYHGLHYNRAKISEEFEHLCSRYAERYVGAETQSTCTVFETNPPSSSKRRGAKPRWMAKSPGRRLSHLARRRITFSNGNLQGTSSSILGSRARQILVDAKKLSMLHRKSPRKSPRKTPSKSPFKAKKSTPSSSAKKKLMMRFREVAGEFESGPSCSSNGTSFKRALFNSPPKQDKSSSILGISLEKKSTKRALFSSPLKRSPQKSPFKSGKRKRADSEDENPSKLPRSISLELKPTQSETRASLSRTTSETMMRSKNEELSDQHKKKLQWAVYEALRLQNVTSTHPQYKVFASVLARVTRKFLPNVKLEGRTTEKMFRVARYHSYAVVKGKSVDEIVNEYMKMKVKNQKPQGYVGIEEFRNMRNSSLDKENVLQDKANIIQSIEKRREHAGTKSKFLNDNRIDRIKKVITFEDNFK